MAGSIAIPFKEQNELNHQGHQERTLIIVLVFFAQRAPAWWFRSSLAVSPWHDDAHGQASQQKANGLLGNRFSIAAEHQAQVTERGGRQ